MVDSKKTLDSYIQRSDANPPLTYLQVGLSVKLALVSALHIGGISLTVWHLVTLQVHPGRGAVDELLKCGTAAF